MKFNHKFQFSNHFWAYIKVSITELEVKCQSSILPCSPRVSMQEEFTFLIKLLHIPGRFSFLPTILRCQSCAADAKELLHVWFTLFHPAGLSLPPVRCWLAMVDNTAELTITGHKEDGGWRPMGWLSPILVCSSRLIRYATVSRESHRMRFTSVTWLIKINDCHLRRIREIRWKFGRRGEISFYFVLSG